VLSAARAPEVFENAMEQPMTAATAGSTRHLYEELADDLARLIEKGTLRASRAQDQHRPRSDLQRQAALLQLDPRERGVPVVRDDRPEHRDARLDRVRAMK
jgi:hypothetical protein